MDAELRVEAFGGWREEAMPLFRAHWAEIARHREQVALDPDWARYQRLEDAGQLLAVTMRERWKLVGYCTVLIAQHLHYRTLRMGIQDMVYVVPEHRAGGFGYCALVRFTDAELARRGVQISHQRDKAAHALEAVYRRLHYGLVERTHEKVLLPLGGNT